MATTHTVSFTLHNHSAAPSDALKETYYVFQELTPLKARKLIHRAMQTGLHRRFARHQGTSVSVFYPPHDIKRVDVRPMLPRDEFTD